MPGALDPRPSATSFDPYGEPVVEGVAGVCTSSEATDASDRMARRIGGAVFWSLALAILAGRIYAADLPVIQTVASYGAQAFALR